MVSAGDLEGGEARPRTERGAKRRADPASGARLAVMGSPFPPRTTRTPNGLNSMRNQLLAVRRSSSIYRAARDRAAPPSGKARPGPPRADPALAHPPGEPPGPRPSV